MKATVKIKGIAYKVVNAILSGAHTTEMIVRNQSLETQYRDVCKALAWLQEEGLVEYHNRNVACEYGYFITDEGWSRI